MCQLTSWFKNHPFVLINFLRSSRTRWQTFYLIGFFCLSRVLLAHDRKTGQGSRRLVCKMAREERPRIGMALGQSCKVCG